MKLIAGDEAAAWVAGVLERHDPADAAWRAASVDLARATPLDALLEQHAFLRRLRDISEGMYNGDEGVSLDDALEAMGSDLDAGDIEELLEIETVEEGVEPGSYCGGLDPQNAVPVLFLEEQLVSLLALPGEPAERWPVVYSSHSASQSHVVGLDLPDLIDQVFTDLCDFAYPFDAELDEFHDDLVGLAKLVVPVVSAWLGVDAERALMALAYNRMVPEELYDWRAELFPPGTPEGTTCTLDELFAATEGAYSEVPKLERRVAKRLYRELDKLCVRSGDWTDVLVPPKVGD